ncbi:MAG: hypothetical protein ACLFT6_07600 [Bacteroidales bacterium]
MCLFVFIFAFQIYNLSAGASEDRGEFDSIALNFFQSDDLETGLEELNNRVGGK